MNHETAANGKSRLKHKHNQTYVQPTQKPYYSRRLDTVGDSSWSNQNRRAALAQYHEIMSMQPTHLRPLFELA